jgi:hypothetical protein
MSRFNVPPSSSGCIRKTEGIACLLFGWGTIGCSHHCADSAIPFCSIPTCKNAESGTMQPFCAKSMAMFVVGVIARNGRQLR